MPFIRKSPVVEMPECHLVSASIVRLTGVYRLGGHVQTLSDDLDIAQEQAVLIQ
jgi:hypothetical protein